MKTEKKHILVVDDQPRNTRLLKLYLEQTNDYVVREENDPKAALSDGPQALTFDMFEALMHSLDRGGETSR